MICLRKLIAAHRGTTLVEVLIAMIILSMGILATGLIYIESISALTRNTNIQRAQRMAFDLAETVSQLSAHIDTANVTAATTACDSHIVCNPQQLAGSFYSNWLERLSRHLPAGSGSLTLAVAGGQPAITITVVWEARDNQVTRYDHIAAVRIE